ncbi:hypothetical protein HHK36_032448 [Tetracentron sinense]|uniref:Uncharacterized protein n=1 Tax=Tetracentron sinense TaxID=13715 RepID=A0A835D0E7_TETSI|nr:hypothetical protein HHK36_032448 [Tetracentron sinense]
MHSRMFFFPFDVLPRSDRPGDHSQIFHRLLLSLLLVPLLPLLAANLVLPLLAPLGLVAALASKCPFFPRCFSLLLVFLAYRAAQNLESTMNKEDNLGTTSLDAMLPTLLSITVIVYRLGGSTPHPYGSSGTIFLLQPPVLALRC